MGARTELDAERFVALGVAESRVRVTGDLKLDPPAEQPGLASDLIRALADAPVLVGGSTYHDEEILLMDGQDEAEKSGHAAILVLAPRQVERGPELIETCRKRNRRPYLRSQLDGRQLAAGDVLIVDTLGELTGIYAVADIAFVGGSLVPIGGHNLVEPAHVGCPVLFGPHIENVREAAAILEVGRAGIRVHDARALGSALVEALADPEACRLRGEVGRKSLEAHRGSVHRTHQLLEEVLDRFGHPRPRSDADSPASSVDSGVGGRGR